jgi:hypothetical protein
MLGVVDREGGRDVSGAASVTFGITITPYTECNTCNHKHTKAKTWEMIIHVPVYPLLEHAADKPKPGQAYFFFSVWSLLCAFFFLCSHAICKRIVFSLISLRGQLPVGWTARTNATGNTLYCHGWGRTTTEHPGVSVAAVFTTMCRLARSVNWPCHFWNVDRPGGAGPCPTGKEVRPTVVACV